MTPEQKALARRTLGLPNPSRRSRRNARSCGPTSSNHAVLTAMVATGHATLATRLHGLPDLFRLTRAGAEAALEPGESLNPMHFPPLGQD